MKKIFAGLVAAALSTAAVVGTSSSAEARWWGWGYGGWGYRGLGWGPGGLPGAVVGAALATPYYYYPLPAYPTYYYYSYPAPAYYYYAAGGCCY